MTPTTLACPRCRGKIFLARLRSGKETDTHTYIELCCRMCSAGPAYLVGQTALPTMQFVVDLTPEFDRSEV